MLTISTAAQITAIIVGLGLLQGSVELLSSLRAFIADGLFDYNSRQSPATGIQTPVAGRQTLVAGRHARVAGYGSLRTGMPRTWMPRTWMLGRSGQIWLRSVVVTRIVCAAALIIPLQNSLLYASYATIVLLTSLFLADQIRYGKDGSNQISVIIIAGLAFTFLMPDSSPFKPVGLYFIAAQALLSYFSAGLSKLRSARWRDGSALQSIFNTATYGHATTAGLLRSIPWLGGFVGWSVLIIEMVFPVAVIAPPGVLVVLLGAGLLLHLGTAVLIGLDTFFWAFTATFPAIIVAHAVLAH